MKFVQPIRSKEKIEEIKNILKHQSYRNYFLFVFGINSGLRISDILPLKVKDVLGTHITIKEEKTNKEKEFFINPVLRLEIDAYIQGMGQNDYLFPSRIGKNERHIERKMAYNILNEAGAKAGLGEIGTHTLRKTFGYHEYREKKDLVLLQKLFNHNSRFQTAKYIGLEKKEVDELLRTDGL